MPYSASEIYYVRTGDGPPAIMIHGNPATHSLWRPIVQRVESYRTVYAIDLPGFGKSPFPSDRGDLSLENLARLFLDFADLQSLDRFDLVGHSFGGAISINMAVKAPERLRSLVAITPMIDRIPPLGRLGRVRALQFMSEMIWRAAPGSFRRWFGAQWAHVSYGMGYRKDRAEEIGREADRPDIVNSLFGLMIEADYEAYTGTIERLGAMSGLPVLLVGAAKDKIIPKRHFDQLRARLPQAGCHVFEESGHVPMWQHSDELAELLRGFWAECDGEDEQLRPTATISSMSTGMKSDTTGSSSARQGAERVNKEK